MILLTVSMSLVLQPYKYSGYPMLIKTIQMEIEDANAFSKPAALLPSACELCYHTVNTSALNAEELRRENGIEVCVTFYTTLYHGIRHHIKPYHAVPYYTIRIGYVRGEYHVSFIARGTISYFVTSERRERGTRYDIVTRAIKLILPSLECDNQFITYLCLYLGQKSDYIFTLFILSVHFGMNAKLLFKIR